MLASLGLANLMTTNLGLVKWLTGERKIGCQVAFDMNVKMAREVASVGWANISSLNCWSALHFGLESEATHDLINQP